MKTKDEIIAILRNFKEEFGERYGIEKLGLFGSVARGEQKEDSDIDKTKNIKLSDEIDKCIDGLYQKNVPQNVRDFIDMMSAKKPARKPRNFLPAETKKQSEQ